MHDDNIYICVTMQTHRGSQQHLRMACRLLSQPSRQQLCRIHNGCQTIRKHRKRLSLQSMNEDEFFFPSSPPKQQRKTL